MALQKGVAQTLVSGITQEEVHKIARLANLKIPVEAVGNMVETLSDVLSHITALREVDTENVKPTSHPITSGNVFRADEVKEIFDRDKILKNAPTPDGNYFSVPRVIE